MSVDRNGPQVADPLRPLRLLLSVLILLIAASVLAGWFLHVEELKTVLPGLTTMKANTALGLFAGGTSAALLDSKPTWARRTAAAAAALIGVIGLLTLVEYVAGVRLGIDELIVSDPATTSRPFAGRMSPATATAFLASGLSLGLLALARSRRSVATAHGLAALPAAVSLLALAGYAYGVQRLYSFGPFIAVALHTGMELLLLTAAILLARRREGWEQPFLDRPIALRALLQILIVSLAVPFTTGLLIVWGTHRGLYQPAFSPALFAVVTAGALIWLAFRSARILSAAEGALLQARKQASAIERRLDLALSGGRGIGTWDWDVVNDKVVADERFAALYGVDPDAARLGAPIAEFFSGVHPHDLARVRERVDVALHTGDPFSEEYRLIRQDRAECWVVAEGRCELSADGTPLRFPGVSFDITARKQAEARQAALLTLQDRLRDLDDPEEMAFVASEVLGRALGASRVGYGLVDTSAETITIGRDWNAPGVHTLAGVLQFREYGTYIDDLRRGETVVVTDAEHDPRTQATAQALKGITAQAFVNMPLLERGGFVALLYATQAIAREWSGPELALMREVAERVRVATERVQAQIGRLQSEEQFRVFAQAVPNHIWSARPDGYLDWFNDRAYAYAGVAPGDLDGPDGWARVVHPDDLGAAGPAWANSLASGQVYESQFRIRRHDGAYRWFLVRAEPVRAANEDVLRWVGTNTDIDDAKRQEAELAHLNEGLEAEVAARTGELMAAEEQLRQSQKMEAVGQLTGGIAHDFNNLLTGVTGSLELIRSRMAQGRFDAVDRYLHVAEGAAKRAATLTQRLLAFSRRQTLDPRPTDVNRLVAGLEEILRRTVGPAISVEVVGAGGLWSTLVDPGQLDNALLNLCINARDAMPEGGRLTIETANKWLDDRTAAERDLQPGQYVSLCVTDTGTGMTPEVITRAFDPFFTTKPLGSGTGLGLSMIYGFVRQSGGQVRIYSELGQGTTMCLYLPRFVGEAERAEGLASEAEIGRAGDGETVLVVDDEPSVRMLVTEILEEAGYLAIEAIDGASGLKILESGARIDLLITDVGLPGGMNGRQVADAGRALRPGLKVLFITGYAENAAVGNGHLEPGMEVLTKPFPMEGLAAKVRELITS